MVECSRIGLKLSERFGLPPFLATARPAPTTSLVDEAWNDGMLIFSFIVFSSRPAPPMANPEPTVAGIKRGPRGKAILSQIGILQDLVPAVPPANEPREFASLDLKRGRNRNIFTHLFSHLPLFTRTVCLD